ncbi:CesT family type III secretion system chaperone [Chromobacterium sphagni]|uniref:Type III secretion chaperone SycN n=1 Tax=Chromobacterium sphagni TaxID=1903179 RepID=A0ABX3CDT5_9NEIS|nr:CesT family type III secretion system chaperone [Chromobacterium sphagni]OHX20147.1 hypothetical protein BI344_06475 [Chromobacterium sphagni]
MQDLSAFHHCTSELLQHLGFAAPVPASGQEVISLTVEQRFNVHLGAIDHDNWFMLAELGECPPQSEETLQAQALRGNQLCGQAWQPVAALDAEHRLCCWLRLPCRGLDLPQLAAAFDALVARAEALLQTADAPR